MTQHVTVPTFHIRENRDICGGTMMVRAKTRLRSPMEGTRQARIDVRIA